jgi:antitoxin component of MazEF toxin-antitoxin module
MATAVRAFIRRVQSAGGRSCAVTIPRFFVKSMRLGVGSYVLCTLSKDGRTIFIETIKQQEDENEKREVAQSTTTRHPSSRGRQRSIYNNTATPHTHDSESEEQCQRDDAPATISEDEDGRVSPDGGAE